MSVDRKDANLKTLQKADSIQDKTQEAIWRIQKQAAEAEGLGTQTLEELRRQDKQLDDINNSIDGVGSKLDTSLSLQTQFDLWAGNWFGGKRLAANKEAAAEIVNRHKEEYSKVKEVFQQEKYDPILRKWKSVGLVLTTNTSMAVNDIFDPYIQESVANSRWAVDYSMPGTDEAGWTYAFDFATLNKQTVGEPTPGWNSFARRRKWRYNDESGRSATLDAVRQRNNERFGAKGIGSKSNDKSGLSSTMTASGLTSTSMAGKNGRVGQDLDPNSAEGLAKLKAKDAEIDKGLNVVGNQLDTLGNIARTINEETVKQTEKIKHMDNKMSDVNNKMVFVNARQKQLTK